MKIFNNCQAFLVTLLMLAAWTPLLWAGDRPPETMLSANYEVPAAITPVAGGTMDSFVARPTDGLFMSGTLGETFSGRATSDAYELNMGYGFFEFYSDRIPITDLELVVNGGDPLTNARDIELNFQFRDDLSGLVSGSVLERGSGQSQILNLTAGNRFNWRLGGNAETVQDGDFIFEFSFTDRAGNTTVTPATASVRLDRVSPEQGTVSINNGNIFTSSRVVSVELASTDNTSDAPTGVRYVRLSNTANEMGVVYPFVEPKMAIQWTFPDDSEGEKNIYARFRDGAGNWSVAPASDTIVVGRFSPGGNLSFQADGTNVIEVSSGVFETKVVNVPVVVNWSQSSRGSLKSIEISGGPNSVRLDVAPDQTPPLVQPYAIGLDDALDGTYSIQAIYIDADGNRSLPVNASITLNRNPPPAPEVNLVVYASSIAFQVSPATPAVHDIQFYTVIPGEGLEDLGATPATLPVTSSTDVVTYVDDGLIPNTRYSYTVRAHDPFAGSIPGHQTGVIVTLAEDAVRTKTPEGIEINMIRVEWGTGNNPLDTEYHLEWSPHPDYSAPLFSNGWSVVTKTDVGGLSVGSTYYFRVTARNRAVPPEENPTFTELGMGVTQSFIQPLPPVVFEAVDVASTTIFWRWVRNPSTEEGFIIRNATGGVVAEVALEATVPSYTFLETGLLPNTLHSRTILSFNHLNGELTLSAPSATQNIRTRPAPPLPGPFFVRGSEIRVTWGTNQNPEGTTYKADIALNPEFTNGLESTEWIEEFEFLFRGLRPQTTYYARVTARGNKDHEDKTYDSLPTDLGWAVTQTFDHGSELDLADQLANWRLRIPANALEEDFAVQMVGKVEDFTTTQSDVINEATRKAMNESNGYRFPLPGGIVEIKLLKVNGDPLHTQLKKNAALFHQFDQLLSGNAAAGGGTLSAASISPSISLIPDWGGGAAREIRVETLRLYVLDNQTQSWFRLPSNDVHVLLNEVEGGLPTMGVFAVMGAPSLEVNDVIAYPVPWRPNGPNAGDGAGQTGTESTGIRFSNLPQEGVLKIVDLRGGLVRKIPLTGGITVAWDGKNESGEKAVSGTYYWITEAGGNRKLGKLMVIR